MSNKFWFVWNPTAQIPTYRHYSLEHAKQEAKRLAMQNPGTEFIVLESIGTVVKNEVIWKGHGTGFNEEEIPF